VPYEVIEAPSLVQRKDPRYNNIIVWVNIHNIGVKMDKNAIIGRWVIFIGRWEVNIFTPLSTVVVMNRLLSHYNDIFLCINMTTNGLTIDKNGSCEVFVGRWVGLIAIV